MSHPNVCIRCHRSKATPGAWCDACHPLAMAECREPMLRVGPQDRPPLPPGSGPGPIRWLGWEVPRCATGRPRRTLVLDIRRALAWPSEPSPSWHNLVRTLEDHNGG